jgi:hypothetical protein
MSSACRASSRSLELAAARAIAETADIVGRRARPACRYPLRRRRHCLAALVDADGRYREVPREVDELLIVTTSRTRDTTERRLRAVSRRGRLAHWFGEHGDPEPA